jgi:hypothetical protein
VESALPGRNVVGHLMEATALEKGRIYRHFPSKEVVAVEAFDYAWQLALDPTLLCRRPGAGKAPTGVGQRVEVEYFIYFAQQVDSRHRLLQQNGAL